MYSTDIDVDHYTEKYTIYKRQIINLHDVARAIEDELDEHINYMPGIYMSHSSQPIDLNNLFLMDTDGEPHRIQLEGANLEDAIEYLLKVKGTIHEKCGLSYHPIIGARQKRFKQLGLVPTIPHIGISLCHEFLIYHIKDSLKYTRNNSSLGQRISGLVTIQRSHINEFMSRQETYIEGNDESSSAQIIREAIRDEIAAKIEMNLMKVASSITKFIGPYIWHIHYLTRLYPATFILERSVDYRAKDNIDNN